MCESNTHSTVALPEQEPPSSSPTKLDNDPGGTKECQKEDGCLSGLRLLA